jgi:hypothetical protein
MMQLRNNNPVWSAPIRERSPQEVAGNVSPSMHVAVLVGARDDVAPPAMSRDHAETLKKRVNHVTLTITPGLGHEIRLEFVSESLCNGRRRNPAVADDCGGASPFPDRSRLDYRTGFAECPGTEPGSWSRLVRS